MRSRASEWQSQWQSFKELLQPPAAFSSRRPKLLQPPAAASSRRRRQVKSRLADCAAQRNLPAEQVLVQRQNRSAGGHDGLYCRLPMAGSRPSRPPLAAARTSPPCTSGVTARPIVHHPDSPGCCPCVTPILALLTALPQACNVATGGLLDRAGQSIAPVVILFTVLFLLDE